MRAVVLSLCDPWRASYGGTMRTTALIRSLSELGHEVVCVYPSTDTTDVPGVANVAVSGDTLGHREWPAWARRVKRSLLPVPTTVASWSSDLARALRAQRPADLLVLSEISAAGYRRELPEAAFWLDQVDVTSRILVREAAQRSGIGRRTANLQRRAVASAERRWCARADIVTAAGWSDAELLEQEMGRPVTWLPNAVAGEPCGPSASRTAGFFGNFAYWPNRDAAAVLARYWWPRLAEAGWRVVVAGLDSDSLRMPRGIEVLGPLSSPRLFYEQVDMTLAPIRLGGGMKVKVVESLIHGRPVLASEFAVDGFPEDVRRLVTLVDLYNPAIPAVVPPLGSGQAAALEPFTMEGFVRRVNGLVAVQARWLSA